MSRKPRDKAWEHSRYKDWRPTQAEAPKTKRGRGPAPEAEAPPPRRRRSVTGRLLRGVLWMVVLVAALLTTADWLNGRARAAPGECRVALVVDAGAVLTDCPEGPGPGPRLGLTPQGEIAGYRAPRLFRPGCLAEVPAAVAAAFQLRKALYGADRIELRTGAEAATETVVETATEPETDVGPETAPETVPETAPETAPDADTPATVEPADETATIPDPTLDTPSGLRVLVDGVDVAQPMLASGRVQPLDGPGWCS